jgi:hypothetical protein
MGIWDVLVKVMGPMGNISGDHWYATVTIT